MRIRGRDGGVLATGVGADVAAAGRCAAQRALQALGHVKAAAKPAVAAAAPSIAARM